MADVLYISRRLTNQDWMSQVACTGQTQHFFPPHGEQADARERREAIARTICQACEVRIDCRDYAREHREQGFWGGENDDQRMDIRRKARARNLLASSAHGNDIAMEA